VGGPPGAGPPGGGPPGGGPPQKSAIDLALDAAFEGAFNLLYASEPEGKLDSSKNLRVLWVRALLASLGKLDDDVAFDLLPRSSRWLVGKAAAPFWPDSVTDKLSWVVKRTEFIDAVVDNFVAQLPAGAPPAQVVLVGSGYDTRSLRYTMRGAPLSFFELDLPAVVQAKAVISARLEDRQPPPAASLAVDLNQGAGTVLQRLREECGLDANAPTLVVVEAVLFYLAPPAKSNLLSEISDLLSTQPASYGSRLVLADNLAPFVRGPMRAAAEGYLAPMGLRLRQHDTLWGGAIQFWEAEAAGGA